MLAQSVCKNLKQGVMMKKIILSIIALCVVGNMLYAESIEDEIARLKQENELLELQKKNEELNKTQVDSKTNTDKSGFLGFCKGKFTNTGCFIGAEIGYSSGANSTLRLTGAEMAEGNTTRIDVLDFQTTYNVPLNLIIGWQWYFSQYQGFNFKFHLGYSLIGDIKYNGKITDMSDEQDIAMTYGSQALNYGFEVQYRHDLLSRNIHTLGLHAGMGYEFMSFIGNKLDFGQGGTIDLNTFTNMAFTYGIGIHYYLKTHHQFALDYRFRGYTTSGLDSNKTLTNLSTLDADTRIIVAPKSVFSFSYAYRF